MECLLAVLRSLSAKLVLGTERRNGIEHATINIVKASKIAVQIGNLGFIRLSVFQRIAEVGHGFVQF